MPPPRMKLKELLELLAADGWYQARMKGSPRQFGIEIGVREQFH